METLLCLLNEVVKGTLHEIFPEEIPYPEHVHIYIYISTLYYVRK